MNATWRESESVTFRVNCRQSSRRPIGPRQLPRQLSDYPLSELQKRFMYDRTLETSSTANEVAMVQRSWITVTGIWWARIIAIRTIYFLVASALLIFRGGSCRPCRISSVLRVLRSSALLIALSSGVSARSLLFLCCKVGLLASDEGLPLTFDALAFAPLVGRISMFRGVSGCFAGVVLD